MTAPDLADRLAALNDPRYTPALDVLRRMDRHVEEHVVLNVLAQQLGDLHPAVEKARSLTHRAGFGGPGNPHTS